MTILGALCDAAPSGFQAAVLCDIEESQNELPPPYPQPHVPGMSEGRISLVGNILEIISLTRHYL